MEIIKMPQNEGVLALTGHIDFRPVDCDFIAEQRMQC